MFSKITIIEKSLVFAAAAGLLIWLSPASARYSDNDAAEAFYSEGWHLMNDGKPNQAEAIKKYREAVRLDPRFVAAYINLSQAYNSLGDFSPAVNYATQALKYNNRSSYAFANRATAYEGMQQYENAVKDYSEAIASEPDNSSYYLSRARCLQRLFKKSEAEQDLKKALSLPGTNADDALKRGAVLLENRDFKNAIVAFTTAYKRNPSYITAIHDRGLCQAGLGNFKAAIADYNACLQKNPSYTHCYYLRGLASMMEGNNKAASSDFRTFIKTMNYKGAHAIYAITFCVLADQRMKNESGARELLKESRNHFSLNQWPGPIIRYLSGELSAHEVLKFANNPDLLTEAKTCIGYDLSTKGAKSDAQVYLKWVKENGNKAFSEYQLSVTELNRMAEQQKLAAQK